MLRRNEMGTTVEGVYQQSRDAECLLYNATEADAQKTGVEDWIANRKISVQCGCDPICRVREGSRQSSTLYVQATWAKP